MRTLLAKLQKAYPALRFSPGSSFCWSPETREIFYDASRSDAEAAWALLHETGHALLAHSSYKADVELVRLEVAAWGKAKEVATTLGIEIDEEHIQDCLDTYREWLHKRSICPACGTQALQQNDYAHYRCFNCHAVWRVTPSRFARAYRSTKHVRQPALVFHVADGPL